MLSDYDEVKFCHQPFYASAADVRAYGWLKQNI